jgi:hypothetical protein
VGCVVSAVCRKFRTNQVSLQVTSVKAVEILAPFGSRGATPPRRIWSSVPDTCLASVSNDNEPLTTGKYTHDVRINRTRSDGVTSRCLPCRQGHDGSIFF